MSSIEKASSVYALMNTFSSSPVSSESRPSSVSLPAPASAEKGEYVMSDWAKLIIIWSLLQSMTGENDTRVLGAHTVQDASSAFPPNAGMIYDAKGKMTFGPSPAGEALAAITSLPESADMGGVGSNLGGSVTTGVGGGMAGAFLSVSA